ncbi:major royal jelly protein 1-like [Hetaerina americana]|uniref:major royal jelly protein 1-like n=1 Tax=Hetaerina americana TaxID=62018 RepID=UPI003A7F144A
MEGEIHTLGTRIWGSGPFHALPVVSQKDLVKTTSGAPWTWSLTLALTLAVTGSWINLVEAVEVEKIDLQELYGWKTLDYAWPSKESRDVALARGDYIPINNIIVGIKVWEDRLFISLPRWQPGVPSTLNWVSYNFSEGFAGPPLSPSLNPFPSWEMQEIGNCSAIQFVQSMEIDPLGRMWVLDAGRRNFFTNTPDTHCPPRLVLLDVKQDNRVLHTFVFPDNVVSHTLGFLNDLVVDVSGGGDGSDWYAYISDSGVLPDSGGGIVVYHLGTDRAWRVYDKASMNVETGAASEAVIGGKMTVLRSNVDGIGLASLADGTDRVFYAPLGSFNLYSLPTSLLRNPPADPSEVTRAVVNLGRRTSQGDGMAVDSTGAIYFGLLNQDGFARWPREARITEGNPSNAEVLAVDPVRLQWVNSFSFDNINKYQIVLSDRVQMLQGYNPNEVNFRVFRHKINARSYMYPD